MGLIRFLFIASILFSVVSCKPLNPPKLNGGTLQTVDGYSYFWGMESFPIHVLVDSSVSNKLLPTIILAADAWNTEVGVDIFLVKEVDPSHPAVVLNNAHWGAITVGIKDLGHNDFAPFRKIQGIAQPFLYPRVRGKVISGKVWLDSDLEESLYVAVAVHELGHALGLAHDSGDQRSIMYPYTSPEMNSAWIMPDDRDHIRKMFKIEEGPDAVMVCKPVLELYE